jgi:hypothetical protein
VDRLMRDALKESHLRLQAELAAQLQHPWSQLGLKTTVETPLLAHRSV